MSLQRWGLKKFISHTLNYVKRCFCRADLILKRLWIREFHRLYYYSGVWGDTYYLGIPIQQCPLDMWILQEIIYETKPDFVIETGTYQGGSALFFAHVFDLIGHGKVVTIDEVDRIIPLHSRIIKIVGDSTSSHTVSKVKKILIGNQGGKVMVFLDSAHSARQVLKELILWSQFVSKGCYLVVADTNVNGHPVLTGYREKDSKGGPMEAVLEFIKHHNEFIIDRRREKFFMTFFPEGFLLRVR